MSLESLIPTADPDPEPEPDPNPDLLRIMKTVNEALPQHGRGMMSPEQMRQSRTASCFGRQAIIGSQLMYEGYDPVDLAWLISLNHGLRQTKKFTKARHTLGHAFLAVNGPAPVLVDAIHGSFLQKVGRTTWDPERGHDQVLPIVDHTVASEIVVPDAQYKFGNITGRRTDPEAARAWVLRAFFSYHLFDEGMAYYQKEHPTLRRGKIYTPDDYAEFYSELEQQNAAIDFELVQRLEPGLPDTDLELEIA